MSFVKVVSHLTTGLLIGAGVVLGMSMTYHDEVTDNIHFCKMVEEGSWPDYKKIYEEECE